MAVPRIPERFLRHIWKNGLFDSSSLFTSDGVRVAVRSPGVINPDGGPDFTGASVRIGHVLYRGDVELHIRGSAWRAHRHCTDPHYNRVILHVALLPGRTRPRTASGRVVPLLVLSPFIDPALYDRWTRRPPGEPAPALRCHGRNRRLPFHALREVIVALGRTRIESRVRSLGKRLRALIEESERRSGGAGMEEEPVPGGLWDQLLYECMMEGMGYAKNRSAFLALARSVPLSLLKEHGLRDAGTLQAILFGAAGLLPSMPKIRDGECRSYVRSLRRHWRALRPLPGVPSLHEGDWMFFRLRPVNFPTARLAAFCFLLPSLFTDQPLERILGILRLPGVPPRARHSAIVSLFGIQPDRFWSRHCSFCGRRPGGGIALGRGRVHELIVNGVVPLLLLHARVFPDRAVRRESLALLRGLPAAEENGVTRLVEGALRGGTGARGVKSALRSHLEHQGLLHLYRVYCSRGRCGRCPLGAGLRRGKARTAAGTGRVLRMSRRCSPARTSRWSPQ